MNAAIFAAALALAPLTHWHAYGCHMSNGARYTGIADKRAELPKGCRSYVRVTHGKAVHP